MGKYKVIDGNEACAHISYFLHFFFICDRITKL